MVSKPLKRTIAVIAGILVAAAWIGAAAAFVLLDLTVGQWTVIVTVAAVITEAAIWVGVALLGMTALQRFSLLARRRKPSSGAAS